MPQSHKKELSTALYGDLVGELSQHALSGTKGIQTSFLSQLCQRLTPHVYLAGNAIVRAGDLGKNMFFIHKGQAQVLVPAGKLANSTNDSLIVLSDGDHFGQVAIVLPQQTRTASVVSLTDTETLELSRAAWVEILEMFPTHRAKIMMNVINFMQESYPDLFDMLAQCKRDPCVFSATDMDIKRKNKRLLTRSVRSSLISLPSTVHVSPRMSPRVEETVEETTETITTTTVTKKTTKKVITTSVD
jgi:CRP-like cAMP-binding protein